uniref:Intermediate filament tail domain protein n=1 Tax=Caenorhabditis tropicalis TaxID=1561998 RepID=A0A1I7TV95_9PELO
MEMETEIPASEGRVLKIETEMGSNTMQETSPTNSNAAKSFLESTDKEKKTLQGLNDRLGSYIDCVKKLEDQNRKLVGDLEEVRGKWGGDTCEVKIKYSESLSIARKEIDDSSCQKAEIDVKLQRLKDDLTEYESRYKDIQNFHEEDKRKIDQWTNEIGDCQSELERLNARENFKNDTRKFFKKELADAIRDIKDEYDLISHQGKIDMESWYKLKVTEVQGSANRAAMESSVQREEVQRMRDNMGDIRAKLSDLENKNSLLEKEVQNLNYQLADDQRQYERALNDRNIILRRTREQYETLLNELHALLDTKQMLDAEIAIYRTMLDKEESRVGINQIVEQVVKTHSLQQQENTDSTRSVRGEVSTKTTFQKCSKGNVAISECDPNGKFVKLENTSENKDENIGDHRIKRKLDGGNEIIYTIPTDIIIKPGTILTIYARDQGGVHNPPESLVFEEENTWGVGADVVTTLTNKEGEERATHSQKTIQSGQ